MSRIRFQATWLYLVIEAEKTPVGDKSFSVLRHFEKWEFFFFRGNVVCSQAVDFTKKGLEEEKENGKRGGRIVDSILSCYSFYISVYTSSAPSNHGGEFSLKDYPWPGAVQLLPVSSWVGSCILHVKRNNNVNMEDYEEHRNISRGQRVVDLIVT